jgi:hypothetical protein
MVFLSNPPKADEFLCLLCEMFISLNDQPIQPRRNLFHWGYAQKITFGILYICL